MGKQARDRDWRTNAKPLGVCASLPGPFVSGRQTDIRYPYALSAAICVINKFALIWILMYTTFTLITVYCKNSQQPKAVALEYAVSELSLQRTRLGSYRYVNGESVLPEEGSHTTPSFTSNVHI